MNLDARRTSLYFALIVAWTATLGSLYFSEIRHFIPCTLCWYQRILMYPLSIILLIGIIRRDQGIAYFVLPFSGVGIFLSSYHYLIQKTVIFSTSTACASGVPCTATWINWFGIITIPLPGTNRIYPYHTGDGFLPKPGPGRKRTCRDRTI